MTVSALRPKTNLRRLLYFLGISLAVHLVMLFVFSIDFIFGAKHDPTAPVEAGAVAPVAPPPAVTLDKPTTEMPVGTPVAPSKPKDADAEYQKKQKPATEAEKKQSESIRPDLDQLK